MTDDPARLADRCEATERALADAHERVEAARRAVERERRFEPLESAAAPGPAKASWREGMELTALPAFIIGLLLPIPLAVGITCIGANGENGAEPYWGMAVVARGARPLAPLASACTIGLEPLAAGSCRAHVNCFFSESFYDAEVACSEEVREAPGDDGPPTVRVVVARARGLRPTFEYDEGLGTVVVRAADGGETLLVVESHQGTVVR